MLIKQLYIQTQPYFECITAHSVSKLYTETTCVYLEDQIYALAVKYSKVAHTSFID